MDRLKAKDIAAALDSLATTLYGGHAKNATLTGDVLLATIQGGKGFSLDASKCTDRELLERACKLI